MQRLRLFFLRFSTPILVALLAITTYWVVIPAPFVWDDEVMVVGNGLIRSLDNIPQILTTSPFGQILSASEFYRPLQTLSYALDYAVWELNPTGYRLTSIGLHILAIITLWSIVRRLGYSDWVATSLALIMVVHPIHIESVAYVSGRGDALYLALCLLAFRLVLATQSSRWWWAPVSIVLYISALLTKENAMPMGLILAGFSLTIWKSRFNRLQIATSLALGLASVVYIVTRLVLIGQQGNGTLSWIASADLATRLLTIPYCVWTYVRLNFIPYPLHMEYHYVASSIWDPYLWIAFPITMVAAGLLWRWSKNRSDTLGWLMWFGISLGPVLQLVPLASTVREHWGTLAMIGIWMAILPILDARLSHNRVIRWGGLALVVGCFAVVTAIRNLDWADPYRLYAHDVEYEPRSFLLHNNLGVELYRRGDFAGSKRAFEQSIAATPGPIGYGTALNNLGVIVENEGNKSRAEQLFEQSIQASAYELAYTNLARVLLQRGDVHGGLTRVREGLQRYPHNGNLKLYEVACLFGLGMTDEGETRAQNLLMMYPEYAPQIQLIRQANTLSQK